MKRFGNNDIQLSILITNHNVDCRKLLIDLHGQMRRWGGKGEILEAQANKWSQRTSVLQMETQLEVKEKNDMDEKYSTSFTDSI